MKNFIGDLKKNWENHPFIWAETKDAFTSNLNFPENARVLVLAPHPDDPESVSITLRILKNSGCEIYYSIVTLSPSGVTDDYVDEYYKASKNDDLTLLENKKKDIRQKEQSRSAEMFGLISNQLTFLSLEEGKNLDSSKNQAKIRNHLESIAPDIVIMPIGKDTNKTHVWVYNTFRECAKNIVLKTKKPVVALYNEDPKTTEIRSDLYVLFDDKGAGWKSSLLQMHDSQQQRNINKRGMGFDERILQMNKSSFKRLPVSLISFSLSSAKFAEVFEIELFESQ